MTARLTSIAIVYGYDDGSFREAIKLERPQISQAKREETGAGLPSPVRFLLDVSGLDVTPERELDAADVEQLAVDLSAKIARE